MTKASQISNFMCRAILINTDNVYCCEEDFENQNLPVLLCEVFDADYN